MKEKRILNIFSSLIGFALISASPQIQADELDSAPVLLGRACDYQIRVPENSMGYIPSGDCKTVYVLPSAVGRLQVAAFAPTAHTLLCAGVTEYEQNHVDSMQAIRGLQVSLRKAKSEKEVKLITARIDALTKYMDTGAELFKDKEAATAQLIFKNSVDQSVLDQWMLLNIEVIRKDDVVFRAAPLSTSVLTFSPVQPVPGEPAVLSSSIPGLTKLTDGSFRTVLFQGALSGQVVFSLFGGCPLLNKMPSTMSDIPNLTPSLKNIQANLIANQSYEVSTRSKMKYSAALKKDAAISFLNQYQKERATPFSISEMVQKHGNADISDLVDLKLSVSEMNGAQIEAWGAFKQNFYQDVLTRLSTRMVQELADLKLLNVVPTDMADAPMPGTIYRPQTYRQCSSSSFFGFRTGSSCSDVTVQIPIQVNGHSDLIDDQALNSVVDIRESLEINEPFNYSFTSAFSAADNK